MAKVFVITGPSGVGKGTLIHRLLDARSGIELSVSATTRPSRPGEGEGSDYVFLGREEFDRRVQHGDFLEHARYAGNMYGTPLSEIRERLTRDISVVLEIEMQGAGQVREKMPEAVQIFIKPPSWDDLRKRLEGRNTDSSAEIEARLRTADEELKLAADFGFDAVIVNDSIERAAAELLKTVEKSLEDKAP